MQHLRVSPRISIAVTERIRIASAGHGARVIHQLNLQIRRRTQRAMDEIQIAGCQNHLQYSSSERASNDQPAHPA